jgi:hypothetical protein
MVLAMTMLTTTMVAMTAAMNTMVGMMMTVVATILMVDDEGDDPPFSNIDFAK